MSGLPGIAARQKSSRRPIGRGIRGGKSTCGGESSELGDGRPLILPSVFPSKKSLFPSKKSGKHERNLDSEIFSEKLFFLSDRCAIQ